MEMISHYLEAVRIEMAIWQIIALFAMACFAIGCLLGICIAVSKLAKGIKAISGELAKLNEKLEGIEVANREDSTKQSGQSSVDPLFADLESALSNFEKLKRIDTSNR
jgi:hypothetical protein